MYFLFLIVFFQKPVLPVHCMFCWELLASVSLHNNIENIKVYKRKS